MSDLDRLERLAALRESGALTEEEYQTEKAKVLAGSAPAPPESASAAPSGAIFRDPTAPPAPAPDHRYFGAPPVPVRKGNGMAFVIFLIILITTMACLTLTGNPVI